MDHLDKFVGNLSKNATKQLSSTLLFIGKLNFQQAILYISGSLFAMHTINYGCRLVQNYWNNNIGKYVLKDAPVDAASLRREEHDRRRSATYPHPITNTWYLLCDSSELVGDKPLEIRALGQSLVLWRDADGNPVCQDAHCLHLGANLAVGGKVVDGCIQCPFHLWRFNQDGSVAEVPYLATKSPECVTSKKLKTYPCKDWCGQVAVYFHAEAGIDPAAETPAFQLPAFVENELKDGEWFPHLRWDIGFTTLNPVDWVDQAGDHSHFHTLHSEFMIPWTTIPIPKWILRMVPLGITHEVRTYRGDDKEWAERVEKTGYGTVEKHYVYFTDLAGLTWDGKKIDSTLSETLEMYCGPAVMVFNIPFTVGTFKAIVSTNPVEGGSIMRVRTWADKRVRDSYVLRFIAWILTGISSSQLMLDINIMNNKIRLTRPIIQPFDGPYNRTNAWLKLFYSKNSDSVGKGCYKNDW